MCCRLELSKTSTYASLKRRAGVRRFMAKACSLSHPLQPLSPRPPTSSPVRKSSSTSAPRTRHVQQLTHNTADIQHPEMLLDHLLLETTCYHDADSCTPKPLDPNFLKSSNCLCRWLLLPANARRTWTAPPSLGCLGMCRSCWGSKRRVLTGTGSSALCLILWCILTLVGWR